MLACLLSSDWYDSLGLVRSGWFFRVGLFGLGCFGGFARGRPFRLIRLGSFHGVGTFELVRLGW